MGDIVRIDLNKHLDLQDKEDQRDEAKLFIADSIYSDLLCGYPIMIGNINYVIDDFFADYVIEPWRFTKLVDGESGDFVSHATIALKEYSFGLADLAVEDVNYER